MDPITLTTALDIVAPAIGQTLSVDQKAAIETSLTILKADQGFHMVFFWGRVNGLGGDYLVAHGLKFPIAILGADKAPEQRFFSTDGTKWLQLPDVDEPTAACCARISKPFTGDPSVTTTLLERAGEAPVEVAEGEEAEAEEDPAPAGYKKTMVSETERLSYAVKAINDAGAVIPRGACILDANDQVVPNGSFFGLTGDDIAKPSSYVHWRPTSGTPKSTVKLGGAASDAIDILDSISEDVPNGCWSMKMNSTSSAMILRHLVWPGAVAFAGVANKMFGYAYFGSGLPNQDIAFML